MSNNIGIKLVPVINEHTERFFVDKELVPRKLVEVISHTVSTGPLTASTVLNVLSLSTIPDAIASGPMDFTDTISPSITLENIYVKKGEEVSVINSSNGLIVDRVTLSESKVSLRSSYLEVIVDIATGIVEPFPCELTDGSEVIGYDLKGFR